MIRQLGRNWVAECDGGCGISIDTGQKSFRQATIYLSRGKGGTTGNYGMAGATIALVAQRRRTPISILLDLALPNATLTTTEFQTEKHYRQSSSSGFALWQRDRIIDGRCHLLSDIIKSALSQPD
jgi:hypothetical protein